MPRWLDDVLLAAGVLAATAFAAEPAAALARRRRPPASRAPPRARPSRPAAPRRTAYARPSAQAADKAKIILADHERLIVTYSVRRPHRLRPDPARRRPAAVLSAARLVLPEDTYEDLAGHLGVPPGWPPE